MANRIERDSMGEMNVPEEMLYGAQTARAAYNFPVSGFRFPRAFLRALGLIKRYAAEVNAELGLLAPESAQVIAQAAQEVADGVLDKHFVLDIFQTGSGTSTNMNANEVIAHRARQLKPGLAVHPNDHVNFGQSSNDVIPSAANCAAACAIATDLLPALSAMRDTLREKARAFDDVVKVGRTHLQDATPIRMGQVFSGYARQVELAGERIATAALQLRELPLGGTAVGTGLNTHPEFAAKVIRRLAADTGIEFREAINHFEAQGARDALVLVSGALKTAAVSLFKIANDIRFLGSGPRCGLGELRIPPVQPGSSIMPGKVNPVMAESLLQVCAQVIGNDAAVNIGGLSGNFELNTMIPVIIHNVLQSVTLLANAVRLFSGRCLANLEVDRAHCAELVEKSLMLATPLSPLVGYDRAAALAKEAAASGQTIRELALKQQILDERVLESALDVRRMTKPGLP